MELIIMFSYNIQTIIAKFLKFKVKVFFAWTMIFASYSHCNREIYD